MATKPELRGLLPLPDRPVSGRQWWIVFGGLSLLALTTRLYDVANPPWVAWDETHFGKFASWYINGTYHFDVHPPLGKLLLAGAGHLTGYNGSYAFEKPRALYNDTNYVGMRSFCALLGAGIVPMSFITVHDLTGSLPAATYAGLFLLLDVGMTTICRFILLDPILMFFMVATTMFNFKINKHRPFSRWWWLNLLMTGLMLGCVLSVKFIGLFVLTVVGLYTIADLWTTFCDLDQPLSGTVKHFLARAVCLIVVPIVTYLLVFLVHETRIGDAKSQWGLMGDGWLSSGQQMRLKNNDLFNLTQPKYLAYGSLVTLHAPMAQSQYLHSHNISYPDWGELNVSSAYNYSHVQVVTGFMHKDYNNFWKILPHDEEDIPDWENPYVPPEPVLNGDVIKLVHNMTGKVLAVFNQRAFVTRTQVLVGAISEKQILPYQSAFAMDAPELDDEAKIEAINTTFRLYNPGLKCCVFLSNEKLPDWTHKQNEVTCSKRLLDEGITFVAQRNIHPRMKNVTKHWRRFLPRFPNRLVETHRMIAAVNARLKPSRVAMMDADHPYMWPILLRGLHFSPAPGDQRVYLLGTPPIWWAALACLFLSGIIMVYLAFRAARGSRAAAEKRTDPHDAWRRRTGSALLWLLTAYVANYLPFWCMSRILYFHHYFPALCYSFMLAGVVLDFLLTSVYRQLPARSGSAVYHYIVACIVAGLFYSFYLFMPLCYGMSGIRPKESVNSTFYHLWWWTTWDF